MPLLTALIAMLAGPPVKPPSPTPDACAVLVPGALHESVKKAYPDYRLVRVSDYAAEDIASERQYHGGHPCLGVASVDVNSDRQPDFAFLLTSGSGHTLVVSALSTSDTSWRLETLMDFGNDGPGRSFVNTLEPGAYDDLYAATSSPGDFVSEPGHARSYRTRRPGFTAGTIESSTIAFFYTGKRWVHLWLAD